MISDAPVSRGAIRRAPLIVAKFGGTSVARADRWQRIEAIAQRHLAEGRRVLLVCSALSGVTDRLESILRTIDAGADPSPMLTELRHLHAALASALGIDGERLLAEEFASLTRCVAGLSGPVPARDRALVLAHGELLSTRLGCAWLSARGHSAAWLDARDLLRSLEAPGDRDEYYLSASCDTQSCPDAQARLDATGASIVVTQGFIARGSIDETVLLGRGGSDASASYLAAALDADTVEIWTDVPGMFTADPRKAPEARLLKRLSYAEAEALGSLGAKVLHPRSIEPAWRRGIPLRLGWTERPDIVGTRVTGARPPRGIKAVVGRRELALVIMTRPSSWQPVGFLADVALCFQRRGLSMDLVASSPSEIRATIDLSAFPSARSELSLLLEDLSRVCRPRAVPRVGCVSVVGAGANVLSCSKLSSAFAQAHVHLVGHAANGSNVSFVVDEGEVAPLVAKAHAALLTRAEHSSVLGPRWDALLASAAPVAATPIAATPIAATPNAATPNAAAPHAAAKVTAAVETAKTPVDEAREESAA